HHPRPAGPTPTPPHPAPTQPLALDRSLAHIVAQHHRLQPTNHRDPLTTPPNRHYRSTQEKLGRPAATPCSQRPTPWNHPQATSIRSFHGFRFSPTATHTATSIASQLAMVACGLGV